jgi:hypothetical protein
MRDRSRRQDDGARGSRIIESLDLMKPLTERTALVCAMYAGMSVLMCSPLFVNPNGVGHFDWDQHLFYYGAVLKSVIEYGQWPFWNPWYCGGNVLWQNPQVALLSPAYPLALIVSLPLAMKVNIVLHYWIGFVGMHLLLRRVAGVRFLPLVMYLACVFVACGALALHVAQGHSTFLSAFYLPILLYWSCCAMFDTDARRDGLLAAAALALMVLNGGFHLVPTAIIGIGVLALTGAAMRRSWRPILVAMVCGVAGFAYAAPKLVPVAAYIESDRFQDDRAKGLPDSMTVEMTAHAYLDPSQNRDSQFQGQLYGWHEYGNYIGLPAVLLIVSALAWVVVGGRATRRWLGGSLALASAMFFALSLGDFSSFAPAMLAHSIPVLSSYRIPSRYTIGFVLFGATLAGWMLRELSWDAMGSRRAGVIVTTLCLLASVDLIWRNGSHFNGMFDQRSLHGGFHLLRRPDAPVTDTTIDAYKQDAPMLRALMANRSTFNCYETLKLKPIAEPGKPLVFGDPGVKIAAPAFTPNRIDVTLVAGPEASRLFVNQSYAPGWRSALGVVTADPRYRNVSVAVPPGTAGRYSIVFSPPGFAAGFFIFALGIVATVWWSRSAGH